MPQQMNSRESTVKATTPFQTVQQPQNWPTRLHLQDAMLREFQEEIARLKAELAAAGSGAGSLESTSSSAGAEASSSAAGSAAELSAEEVARMRQQLEDNLRAEYSGGGAELDAATLEQVRDCRKHGGWA